MTQFISFFLKELKGQLYSKSSFIFILFFVIVLGLFFWEDVFLVRQVQMRGFFEVIPWLFIALIPALTMRSWSEERKAGTFEVLMTSPAGKMKIIMAKFLASLVFVFIILCCSLPYVYFLSTVGDLDFGPIIGSYLGVLFLASMCISIGLWVSSLTKSQVTAFVLGALLIGLLLVISFPLSIFPDQKFTEVLFHASSQTHFKSISKGVIDVRDIVYFTSLSALFLFYNYLSLNSITSRNA